ncbi:MAG: prolipoprotein diacylglyceryl transferase [Herbinix sp.]|jgi:phosphatidylglycerol:prolipoprotein diacylglycerol transferase|nr:prolipoprotein diacylglyceryl transferase [Herbinix sp.]
MHNDLLTIGPVTLHGYGLMIAIGVIAAYMTAEYRAKKMGLNYELIFNLTLWCFVGGMIGARILFYITQIKEIFDDPSLLLAPDGFVVYGGIIGGIFAGFLFCRKEKVNFLQYFDLTMPSIALAQGFGRLGCFLAGCCYGKETTSRFSLIFPEGSYAPHGIRLIPTQLISSGLDFLHFFILIVLAKRVKADGQIAGFYLMFYSGGRFILEFFRGDLERGSVGSISTSQFIAIFLFVIGCGIVMISELRARKVRLQSK